MNKQVKFPEAPTFLDVKLYAIELGYFDPKVPFQTLWEMLTLREQHKLLARIDTLGHADPAGKTGWPTPELNKAA